MIKDIKAKEILDSREELTVEVKLKTEQGFFKASVPAGASVGKYEAVALEAGKAIENINQIIALQLVGRNQTKQREIDEIMIKLDGTGNKSKLGANAILAVSIAVCRAGAAVKKLPLYKYIREVEDWRMPRPCFNIVNGGVHAKNSLEIQEFMVIPEYEKFSENFKIGKEIFKKLKNILEKEFGRKAVKIGDEGGFSPPIFNDKEVLDYLMQAIDGCQAQIGLDCAASQFFSEGEYKLDDKNINNRDLLEFYKKITKNYPIIFFEDPFAETDLPGFQTITKKLGDKIIIVGDDFLTTNIARIKTAEQNKSCNGVIIKPNQVGTITETLEAVKLAKLYGWKIIVSHRSGETRDDFIADLAVGVGADFIKSGAPATSERLAKYNRLLQIEKELK